MCNWIINFVFVFLFRLPFNPQCIKPILRMHFVADHFSVSWVLLQCFNVVHRRHCNKICSSIHHLLVNLAIEKKEERKRECVEKQKIRVIMILLFFPISSITADNMFIVFHFDFISLKQLIVGNDILTLLTRSHSLSLSLFLCHSFSFYTFSWKRDLDAN